MKKHLYGLGFAIVLFSAMCLVLVVIIGLASKGVGFLLLPVDLLVMFIGAWLMVAGKHPTDEVKIGKCWVCQRELPTLDMEFKECRSYILVRQEREIEGRLCWSCSKEIFKKFTTINLTLGWWSIPGLLRTPMLTMLNLAYLLKALKLRTPPVVQVYQRGIPRTERVKEETLQSLPR